jgi:hypothetical protein
MSPYRRAFLSSAEIFASLSPRFMTSSLLLSTATLEASSVSSAFPNNPFQKLFVFL